MESGREGGFWPWKSWWEGVGSTDPGNLGGRGGQKTLPSVRGVWIFSGITHSSSLLHAVLSVVTQCSSPQMAASIRTTFLGKVEPITAVLIIIIGSELRQNHLTNHRLRFINDSHCTWLMPMKTVGQPGSVQWSFSSGQHRQHPNPRAKFPSEAGHSKIHCGWRNISLFYGCGLWPGQTSRSCNKQLWPLP